MIGARSWALRHGACSSATPASSLEMAVATSPGLGGAEHGGTASDRWTARLGGWAECALTLATDVPAATLVVVETVVLLAGVISRYVLHEPLFWSDELA